MEARFTRLKKAEIDLSRLLADSCVSTPVPSPKHRSPKGRDGLRSAKVGRSSEVGRKTRGGKKKNSPQHRSVTTQRSEYDSLLGSVLDRNSGNRKTFTELLSNAMAVNHDNRHRSEASYVSNSNVGNNRRLMDWGHTEGAIVRCNSLAC